MKKIFNTFDGIIYASAWVQILPVADKPNIIFVEDKPEPPSRDLSLDEQIAVWNEIDGVPPDVSGFLAEMKMAYEDSTWVDHCELPKRVVKAWADALEHLVEERDEAREDASNARRDLSDMQGHIDHADAYHAAMEKAEAALAKAQAAVPVAYIGEKDLELLLKTGKHAWVAREQTQYSDNYRIPLYAAPPSPSDGLLKLIERELATVNWDAEPKFDWNNQDGAARNQHVARLADWEHRNFGALRRLKVALDEQEAKP